MSYLLKRLFFVFFDDYTNIQMLCSNSRHSTGHKVKVLIQTGEVRKVEVELELESL